jgi:PTH1 family peptidyl-tRNA hydrolase
MLRLLVGLGNVGAAYQDTRHNVGFEVLDLVAAELEAQAQPERRRYRWATVDHRERRLILAWPKTLMNRSGMAVRDLLDAHEITTEEMLVVVDDFNLPLGALRFRSGGSDGGHNGLASIIETLNTEAFPRLRLGIGPVPDGHDVVDFVLGTFSRDELDPKTEMTARASRAVIFAIDHRLDEAMSNYNSNPARS